MFNSDPTEEFFRKGNNRTAIAGPPQTQPVSVSVYLRVLFRCVSPRIILHAGIVYLSLQTTVDDIKWSDSRRVGVYWGVYSPHVIIVQGHGRAIKDLADRTPTTLPI